MADSITTPEALSAAAALPRRHLASAHIAGAGFPLKVPRSFVARMTPGDRRDPLLRQVLPTAAELASVPGFGPDPVGEHALARAPGLLQKYQGRALLITTAACAVHCRYCFRRAFPYSEQSAAPARLRAALTEIAADESLEEIILSGGDPLSLSNSRLTALTDSLSAIAHVRRLRVHTRTPVVLPSRIDAGCIAWLQGLKLPTVLVLHANHPNEIDAEVLAVCARLRTTGVTLLNQSVLLRGVNDAVPVLAQLSRRLFGAGVLPYYLHALDPVSGAAHFAVADRRARRLLGELAAQLPGYLVPRLVREIQGAPAKVHLAPLRSVPRAASHGGSARGC
jgi:EF-P beta-lysylation protein EpmB